MEMSDRYDPSEVEQRTYAWWQSNHYFRSEDVSTKPPFSVILPPPNVTGSLHLGHALDHTIQDVLVRWKRMSGFNTMWLPGTDHAGIATQSVVEKNLKKDSGTSRHDLGRDPFIEKVWEWKEQYGDRIVEQMKRLGDSCDWDRHTFTLDESVSKSVKKVFVDLYEKGWIYRGTRLINWSPALESAISDLEVDYQEVKGSLYHIRYFLEDGSDSLVIATTRPETLLADSAVAVNPEDTRYASWIGKRLKLPLLDRAVPIVADEHVEMEFGTGALKVTPAHDFNDYEIGKRHNLEMINILNKDGTLNEAAGPYRGLKVKDARKKVVEDLEAQDSLVKTEPHTHQVGHCSRSLCVVEPLLSDQWFVKTEHLAEPAKRVVESGTITFEPESWTKTYLHWMDIIQDWCISRQLWWGHRIPAYYCENDHITVAEDAPEKCTVCGSVHLQQDDDVLDTWFSSGLWPFSTMGWPEETETQKTFYPTSVLVTGHDIIFFWVARMIMAGLEFKKDVPFRKVYIHGLIRDAQGKKMSKSTGNAEDPLQLIDEYGADALRFTLMAQIASGRDLKFSKQRLEGYRNFMNKIWNATRFALGALEGFDAADVEVGTVLNASDLSDPDQWIVHKIGECEAEVDSALSSYRFSDAANAVYSFFWHELCDWYLEFIKPVIYGKDSAEKVATQTVLAQVLNRAIRMLHPFAPFISEEIYQKLPIKSEACIVDEFPTIKVDKDWLEMGSAEVAQQLDLVREVITAIRNIRGENRIKPGVEVQAVLVPRDDKSQKILGESKSYIQTLAKVGGLEVTPETDMNKCAVTPVRLDDLFVEVVVPLEGLVDFAEEVKRIVKSIEKSQKELGALTKRLSNENFLKNAPEDVVAQGKKQMSDLKTEIESLEASKLRLT